MQVLSYFDPNAAHCKCCIAVKSSGGAHTSSDSLLSSSELSDSSLLLSSSVDSSSSSSTMKTPSDPFFGPFAPPPALRTTWRFPAASFLPATTTQQPRLQQVNSIDSKQFEIARHDSDPNPQDKSQESNIDLKRASTLHPAPAPFCRLHGHCPVYENACAYLLLQQGQQHCRSAALGDHTPAASSTLLCGCALDQTAGHTEVQQCHCSAPS